MHAGESVSLTDAEQRELLDFAIKQVGGRVPVIAHVSDAGTAIAAARARHARAGRRGRDRRHHALLLDAAAGDDRRAFRPDRLGGDDPVLALQRARGDARREDHHRSLPEAHRRAAELRRRGRSQPRLAVHDRAHDLCAAQRPDFQLLAGTEHMVSAAAIGATGMFSPLAGVAPQLVRELYDLCRDQLVEARTAQEPFAALRQLSSQAGSRLKAAMRAMGRDCGEPRPPLLPLDAAAYLKLAAELEQWRRCARRDAAAGDVHTAVSPPSSTSTCPVIDAACGPAR